MTFTSHGGGIHPTAVIGQPPESRDWQPGDPRHAPILGHAVRVEAFTTVDAGQQRPTTVGDRTWLMKHSHIGHDALVGADCEIAGARIGGFAVVHDRARIGMGALVMAYRTVGAGAVVGTGAVVTKDVPAGATVVGNPARILNDSERDPRPHSERVTPTAL